MRPKPREAWQIRSSDRFRVRQLARSFHDRETILVAKELLGKHLVHVSDGVERVGRIVEVEACLGPHDLAAHSARGLTERNNVMFGQPGHAYLYFIYGMYYCMNAVTERKAMRQRCCCVQSNRRETLKPARKVRGCCVVRCTLTHGSTVTICSATISTLLTKRRGERLHKLSSSSGLA